MNNSSIISNCTFEGLEDCALIFFSHYLENYIHFPVINVQNIKCMPCQNVQFMPETFFILIMLLHLNFPVKYILIFTV